MLPNTQAQTISVQIKTQNDFLVMKYLSTNKLLSLVWRYINLVHPIKRACKRLWIFTAQIESKSWLQFLAQCKYISIKIALKACRYKVFITDNLTIYQIRRR